MTIKRYRGDTKPIVVTLTSNGEPIPLAGCTAFTLTADPSQAPSDATNNIFTLTGTVLDASAGTVEFLPDWVQANHVGTFYFDVQYLDSRGLINTAGVEKLVFIQDITKE